MFPRACCTSGNPGFESRLEVMVTELRKVQEAMGLGGYLSAFPTEFFDRVESLKPVWAPYYTVGPHAPCEDMGAHRTTRVIRCT